jgi:hypothetical protein
MSFRVRSWIESCQSRGARQCLTAKNARQVEDDTYAEHPEGVVEGGVARRNTGEDFIAPQVAFKERTLAQLVEEMVDFSERPVWSGNQMESMRKRQQNALDEFRDRRTELLGYV